ncbi:DUF4157 domain-containing protein [Streptomyces sp. NPDC012637]|uniref:eCIS core domain-containing protein n=1 Tax=Streptomyces sp. NPDC012637 TaxID=3364842 RepID=UPI0036E0F43E
MRDHDHDQLRPRARVRSTGAVPERGDRRAETARRGLLGLQGTAGNDAVVQMLRRSALPPAQEPHRHGPGCDHGPEVQRSAVHDVLRSPGRPLDAETRTDMEARLGADFSDVRVHDDGAARASAAEVGARAYTSGSHVVIGAGGGDRQTLAHELTHVVQQRRGPVAGTDDGSGLRVSDPSDRFEREADATARRVMSAPAPTVARAPVRSAVSSDARRARGGREAAVQRANDRSTNPHADTGQEHNGWELTAHHIVPHTALKNALSRLAPEERTAVLISAVPAVITRDMARRLGLPEKTNLRQLREKLLDDRKHQEEVVNGTSYDEVREAFFEWQGGNQFLGPNTSIRAEPSADKDGIDVDGKYFVPPAAARLKQEFSRLVSLGGKLKKALKDGAASAVVARHLTDMLALTRDVAPAPFDGTAWVELTDPQQVVALAGDENLGRSHLAKYSFFAFDEGLEERCPMVFKEGNEYFLKAGAHQGGSRWKTYEGGKPQKIAEKLLQRKGKSVYVNMHQLQDAHAELYDYCVAVRVPTSTYLPRVLCESLNVA